MNRRELLLRTSVLLGGAVSASIARGIVAAEQAATSAATTVFDSEQRAQVASIAELIIPTTDTPGAIEAGVPAFIEMMVAQWYTDTERRIFLQGLQDLDQWCQENNSSTFNASTAPQQTAALLAAEQVAAGYEGPEGGGIKAMMSKQIDENIPFFPKVKELTVIGYYTSEVGAKQELVYNPMPMRYDGDFPYAEVARQWSS